MEVHYYALKPGDGTKILGLFRTREDDENFYTEIFRAGGWHDYPPAIKYLFGQDPDSEEISEKEAAKVQKQLSRVDPPVKKHYGPDSHPGTGSSQEVHTPARRAGARAREDGKSREKKKKTFAQTMLEKGGFTYDPKTGKQPSIGFAVSPYKNAERAFSVKEWEENYEEILTDYIEEFGDLLSQPGAHLGGWYDTEKNRVVLDVSIVVQTPRQARQVALEHDQDAFYDLGEGETVPVSRGRRG